jgi:hypothetical protein
MSTKISVKSARDIDGANAYYVTVDGETVAVHTNQRGYGLWIDGKQVEGTSQFSVGKNAAAAYRRYFSK